MHVQITHSIVDLVSVHYETPLLMVTEGHRTVVCVVLEGIPSGGMSQNLPISLTLSDSTAGKAT